MMRATLVLAAVALLAGGVQAGPISFNGRTVLEEATGVVPTASPLEVATITFDHLSLDRNMTAIENGMSYTTAANFLVRTFTGNPPSGLIGSPIAPGTFNITRADHGNFTFDRYDFGSFQPGQQSDTWQFLGLLDGVQQFAFIDATDSDFVTRTTGQPGIIDTLEISVVKGASAAGVADNFNFTLVGPGKQVVPEPSTLTLFGLGTLALLGSRWRRRSSSPK
jgi:hypothetical protein